MNETKLHTLTKKQSNLAGEHYGLVFKFLSERNLDQDEYHDVVIFSYLYAVQIYDETGYTGSFEELATRHMQRAIVAEMRRVRGRKTTPIYFGGIANAS